MISTHDESYINTKLILKKRIKLDTKLMELSYWIENKYKVEVLNIFYDVTSVGKQRPRLEIVLRDRKATNLFRCKNKLNFDSDKQNEITNKFIEILKNSESKRTIKRVFEKKVKYTTNDLLVVFGAFSDVARSDANNCVSRDAIKTLIHKYKEDDIWEITKCFGSVFVFFYTDEQVERYKNSHLVRNIEKDYYNILKAYDEFNCYSEDDFHVYVDSKETFDNKYASNWYYYFK